MANGDERPGAPSTQLADAIGMGFQTIIEGLRSDMREDFRELRLELSQSELRMTTRVAELDTKLGDASAAWLKFMVDHGLAHEAEAAERRQAHGDFYEFIRAAELDAARRDGALGVVRFLIEKLSANATRLVALILTLASAILAITGQVHFVVGR